MVPALLAFALFSGTTPAPAIHFFYRPSCGHCMDVLLEDIPALEKKYTFTLKKYDIDLIDNYRILEKMEAQAGVTPAEDLPVVFVMDSVFYGPENLHDRLEGVLKGFRRPKAKPAVPVDTAWKDTVVKPAQSVEILYFFQPGCKECNRLDALFDNLMKEYPQVRVNRLSIFSDTNKLRLEAISSAVHIPEDKRLLVPLVVIGRKYLIKDEITLQRINDLLTTHTADTLVIAETALGSAEQSIAERFGRFSLLGIATAGLLDGVNPCAFATLVFFVSYLVFLGRRRRDITVMALSFIGAVFIAYFAIGLGAYNLLRYLSGFDVVGRVIFVSFGALALVLGGLSLRDFFLARQGRTDQMLLQLPLGIKQRIHRDIKARTATGGIVLGSFAAGLIISLLEFGCTGQIYLPTITFMVSRAGRPLEPVIALLIYNIMFVLPLIIIALVAVFFTSRAVGQALSAKIPAVKLLTAILFFALGILLILSA